jgi:hypothetical protein
VVRQPGPSAHGAAAGFSLPVEKNSNPSDKGEISGLSEYFNIIYYFIKCCSGKS